MLAWLLFFLSIQQSGASAVAEVHDAWRQVLALGLTHTAESRRAGDRDGVLQIALDLRGLHVHLGERRERLIDAGHAYASILNYTLAQVDAFIAAIDRQESRRLKNLLSVVSVGAQGNSDAIKKFMRRLDV